jgi:glycosyltransferase involved in cell wall biosynthesis
MSVVRKDLTVLIPVRNGMPRLKECIESVGCCEDILVILDDRSDDGTEDFLRKNSVPYFRQKWLGFGPQQQAGVDRVRTDWVMKLDSDEVIGEELNKEIMSLDLDQSDEVFSLKRKNHICEVWIRHGGWWPDRVRRIFNRRTHHFDLAPVHEKIVGKNSQESNLNEALHHYPYDSLEDFHKKIEHYGRLGAEKMKISKKKIFPWSGNVHGTWSFLATYVIRGAFLDGYWGLVVAWSAGAVTRRKYQLAYRKV